MTSSSSRLRDLLQGLVAWALLLGVIVGIPFLLARGVGWPLWRSVPDVTQAGTVLTDGLAERVFLNAVATLVWVVWLQCVLATATEIAASVRGRRAMRLALVPMGLQRSAAQLVGLSMLAVGSLAVRPTPVLAPLPPREEVAPPPDAAEPSTVRLVARSIPVATDAEAAEWSVRRRDTLWKIAEQTLGDGERYREIFELNRHRPQPTGGTLTSVTDRLQPGWVLRLPPDATVAAPNETAAHHREWTVRGGDTLHSIAQRTLGSPARWTEIFDANRGRPQAAGGALVDPDILEIGWVLQVPAAPPRHVEVRAGDTLSTIAAEHLGGADRWPELFEANAGVPQSDGGVLADPNHIETGWTLLLPNGSTDIEPPVEAAVLAPLEERHERVELTPAETPLERVEPTPEEAPDERAELSPIDRPPERVVLTPVDLDPVDLDAADLLPVDADGDAALPVLPLAGAAAAGLVVLAGRMQSAVRRRRRVGERPMRSGGIGSAQRTALRSVANLDAVDTVDRALRTLSHDLEAVPERLRIRCLVIRGDLVGIVFDRPLAIPPSGWITDGNTLLLDKSIDQDLLDALAAPTGRRRPSIAPALVAVGVDAAGVGEIFFDLESTGVLGLAGPADRVTAVHRWLVWAVLSAPWADGADVVVAGHDAPVDLPWITSVATLDEALTIAEDRVASIAVGLEARGFRATTEARMRDPEGPWRPVIVIADHVPAFDAPLARRLSDLDRQGIGAAVLLPGMLGGVPAAVVGDDVVEYPGGISARTPRLDAEHDRAVTAFLQPVEFGPAESSPPCIGQTLADDATCTVRLLGPVEVMVADEPATFEHPLALEIVAWLALHQSAGDLGCMRREFGAHDDAAWAAALDEVTRRLAVHESAGGVFALRHTHTDVDAFRRLTAPTSTGEVSVDRLDEAVRLVRGPILGGPARRPAWADVAVEHLMSSIADAAATVARRHLGEGAALAAARVARRALRACPDSEALHLLVIESAVASGGEEVEAAIDELYDALAQSGGASLGLPSDATLDRIARLRRRHRDHSALGESAG